MSVPLDQGVWRVSGFWLHWIQTCLLSHQCHLFGRGAGIGRQRGQELSLSCYGGMWRSTMRQVSDWSRARLRRLLQIRWILLLLLNGAFFATAPVWSSFAATDALPWKTTCLTLAFRFLLLDLLANYIIGEGIAYLLEILLKIKHFTMFYLVRLSNVAAK